MNERMRSKREEAASIGRFGKKPHEQRQAEVETYADKETARYSDEQNLFLRYAADLARVEDVNELPEGLPDGLKDLIERHKEPFKVFLRKKKNEEAAFVEENIRNYNERFQPVIKELRDRVRATRVENLKNLEGYLGAGDNGAAFLVEVQGKKYAAKFPKTKSEHAGPGKITADIKPLILAKGLDHVAQLAAYSYQDSVTIMELLPGRNLEDMGPDEASFSDEHISGLVETVSKMRARGLMIDPKVSNFMYEPETGFGILDFHPSTDDSDGGFSDRIMDLAETLASGAPGAARADRRLAMMDRLVTILQKDHPDISEMILAADAARKQKWRLGKLATIDALRGHLGSVLAREMAGETFDEDEPAPDDYRKNIREIEEELALDSGGYLDKGRIDRSKPENVVLLKRLEEKGF